MLTREYGAVAYAVHLCDAALQNHQAREIWVSAGVRCGFLSLPIHALPRVDRFTYFIKPNDSCSWICVRYCRLLCAVFYPSSLIEMSSHTMIGLAGMIVTWSFALTVSFNYFVTFAVQSEAKMNSVERLTHYIHNLEPEPEIETAPDKKCASLMCTRLSGLCRLMQTIIVSMKCIWLESHILHWACIR